MSSRQGFDNWFNGQNRRQSSTRKWKTKKQTIWIACVKVCKRMCRLYCISRVTTINIEHFGRMSICRAHYVKKTLNAIAYGYTRCPNSLSFVFLTLECLLFCPLNKTLSYSSHVSEIQVVCSYLLFVAIFMSTTFPNTKHCAISLWYPSLSVVL